VKKSTWQILRKGDQSGLTLTVDFTSTGRTQACFRDLVPLVDTADDVWETVAPPAGEDRGGADYVARWIRGVRKRERVVDTVIGYCVGAVYAAPLAEQLADLQGSRPRLIVLDPELPNIAGLYRDFHGAGGALTTILTPEELTTFHADGEAVRERYGLDDITLIGPALSEIFRAATDVAGVRLGLDEDLRAELGDSFASFVAYLRAATQIDPPARLAPGGCDHVGALHPARLRVRRERPARRRPRPDAAPPGRGDRGVPADDRAGPRPADGGVNMAPRAPVPLPGLFEAQVRCTPDAVALAWGERTLTYAGLNTAVNRLAHHLIGLGAGPERLVAVGAGGADGVVAVLAVLKAGASYLPLDLASPAARIEYMLGDAAPMLVLTTEADRPALPPTTRPVIMIDAPDVFAGEPDHDPADADRAEPLRADHRAYVIYTSGSTGAPKGVEIEHRQLWTYLDHVVRTCPGLRGRACCTPRSRST
jgi:non-ribosomal peptide synthetase component F